MTGPAGNSEFCFPRRSDLLYSKTKQKQNLKTALRFQRSRATTVNISRVTVNYFPFDVIVFAMLPAHGIWRVTVSLLDVMWPWASQWMARCSGKNASYLTNWRQLFMRLSCYWSWISSSHCQSSCGSADYFDNVMKFMINNRTDALKTDINLFFTCLSAYWQQKLANEHAWISAVIVKITIDWHQERAWYNCSMYFSTRPGCTGSVVTVVSCD